MKKIDFEETGKKIKFYRESYGITQIELGRRMNVKNQTVSRWERGKDKNLTFAEVQQIAKILKVDVKEIIGWDPDSETLTGREDKARICMLFTPVLRECRAYPDLKSLDYKKTSDGETVTAVVEDPTGECAPTFIEIDVTADSGIAMLRDILRALG